MPFYGESCYFALDSTHDWKQDSRRPLNSIRDVLQSTYDDAIACHANTLDLREPRDAAAAVREAPEVVSAFMSNAGYRLYPVSIQYPREIAAGETASIKHTWKNLGAGIMPNDNVRWGRKFHVAFALIDPESKELAATAIDPDADPGQWTTNTEMPYVCQAVLFAAAAARLLSTRRGAGEYAGRQQARHPAGDAEAAAVGWLDVAGRNSRLGRLREPRRKHGQASGLIKTASGPCRSRCARRPRRWCLSSSG